MKKWKKNTGIIRIIQVGLALFFISLFGLLPVHAEETKMENEPVKIISAKKINSTTIQMLLSNDQRMTFDFYGENIFRLFQDGASTSLRDPEADPPAKILVDQPRKLLSKLDLNEQAPLLSIETNQIKIELDINTTLFKVYNLSNEVLVLEEKLPILFEKNKVTITLKGTEQEYFYGGGVQNGRFSHKGRVIAIENQNSWTDGGVASPTPFYWSTKGYALLWHTFKKGKYDFGAKDKELVRLSHESDYLDVFFMINDGAVPLLNDFYQLTGNPVLVPKFGFYEGHLNAYNRDYWKEDPQGILFEDGKRYKESQKEEEGSIQESLNGEKDNYQFSARAVIDRYQKKDMPFGWILPNDGYGAGYGQTNSLDGNIANLKNLADYAHEQGVEIGLWTQSDLHPKAGVSPLLQRDIVKEVKDAGVRVLKTDVAWVGAGYSFGLNGIENVSNVMTNYGQNSRPFIISLDGWAGTQRYATVWTGDQTGGIWEYIRFHIPTYIGSGLSGQPNITSDMDGIFGGKDKLVNTRDFQWKAFTPMQLNMDGWGSNPKYPSALGEPTTSFNRNYLKLKSELMPYTYSIAKEAVDGKPMMRALFLDYPNTYTYGRATQYQYLYGPFFLVAPIYQATQLDYEGNDIRNGIYLPEGEWIDYFTGDLYRGSCVLNSFDAPIWKLPVFVKNGAIIPCTRANNNVSQIPQDLRIYEVYPHGKTSFIEYDDDGRTEDYKLGKGVTTLIECELKNRKASITVHPSQGDFDGFVKEKKTEFIVNVTDKPKSVSLKFGKKKLKLKEVESKEDFEQMENVYYYDRSPNMNKYSTQGSEIASYWITKNPQLLVKVETADVSTSPILLTINGFKFEGQDKDLITSGSLLAPKQAQVKEENTEAYSLRPTWDRVANADYYEIAYDSMHYTHIMDTHLLFDELLPQTSYSFLVRAVNKEGHSPWTEFQARTKNNPLEFAITGISAQSSATSEEESDVSQLFDFNDKNLWHTKYAMNALPFDLYLDLKTINQLDKINYLPRIDGSNGIWLKGSVWYSNDQVNWMEAGSFDWEKNSETKLFEFDKEVSARFIKIQVTDAVKGYGSGRELYLFKVPNTESYLPGDINNDHLINENDLTSYSNYMGLKRGDADFEGYISHGDVNQNGLIDAYDISQVATQLGGGVDTAGLVDTLAGSLQISTAKTSYQAGELVEVKVKGIDLEGVNALSFALPYNSEDYEFVKIQSIHTQKMENFSNNRLHTDGSTVLYACFVNIGNKEALRGNQDLFSIQLKAKRKLQYRLKLSQGLLVDRRLNVLPF